MNRVSITITKPVWDNFRRLVGSNRELFLHTPSNNEGTVAEQTIADLMKQLAEQADRENAKEKQKC